MMIEHRLALLGDSLHQRIDESRKPIFPLPAFDDKCNYGTQSMRIAAAASSSL